MSFQRRSIGSVYTIHHQRQTRNSHYPRDKINLSSERLEEIYALTAWGPTVVFAVEQFVRAWTL